MPFPQGNRCIPKLSLAGATVASAFGGGPILEATDNFGTHCKATARIFIIHGLQREKSIAYFAATLMDGGESTRFFSRMRERSSSNPFPMSFAILQKSLDQSIDRRLLEEISTSVPSVARADCARLAREWFGIVVQNISRDEATVFSRLLNAKGFPTEVVRQHELPLLPSPVRRRGLNWDGRVLTAADGMGREQSFPMEGVRFAAGGFVARQSLRSKKVMEWDVRYSYRGTVSRQVVMRDDDELVRETVFRFELFLGCEPFRLQFPVEEESLLRVRGEVLRFRQKDRLAELLREWGKLMPEDGRNLGIQAVLDGAALIYPSPAAFEEEIVWRLFQALRGDGQ